MIKVEFITLNKKSSFGIIDTAFPGDCKKLDDIMQGITPGTLVIAAFVKPLLAWKDFLKKDVVLITGQTRRNLQKLIVDGVIQKAIVLATDTVTYGTSFPLYHTEILLDTPWSRGKLLQRVYRIIRRGSENIDKKIIIVGTKEKLERIQYKMGLASLIEHSTGLDYKPSW